MDDLQSEISEMAIGPLRDLTVSSEYDGYRWIQYFSEDHEVREDLRKKLYPDFLVEEYTEKTW